MHAVELMVRAQVCANRGAGGAPRVPRLMSGMHAFACGTKGVCRVVMWAAAEHGFAEAVRRALAKKVAPPSISAFLTLVLGPTLQLQSRGGGGGRK